MDLDRGLTFVGFPGSGCFDGFVDLDGWDLLLRMVFVPNPVIRVLDNFVLPRLLLLLLISFFLTL
jgi:hypothetical protein